MRIQEFESDAKLFVGDAYDSNSLALIAGEDVLLVEAMAAKKDVEDLKAYLAAEQKKVRMIVATHYFSDHIAGLRHFPDAQIIAQKNYRFTFDSELYRTEEERAFFVEPTLTFGNELNLRWGRFHLRLFHNPGHTMSSICVDIPEIDLLHVADTLVGNIVYLSYSTPSLMSEALSRIRRQGRRNVLSSHMEVRSSVAVEYAMDYLKTLGEIAFDFWQTGREAEDFLRTNIDECLPATVQGSPFETIFHKRNLKTIVERKLFAA